MKHNSLKSGLIAGALALAVVTTALPAPSANAQTPSLSDLKAQIALLLAQIQQLQGQVATPANGLPAITLTRNLSQGMTGSDVKTLQQFLNADPATTVALSGVGSRGNETTYFGPATRAAVIKFQNKYRNEVLTPVGLSQGTGFVGASTRTHMSKLAQNQTPPSNNDGGNNNGGGSNNDDNDDNPIVAEAGDISVTRGSEHTSTLEQSGDFDEIYSIEIKAHDSAMTISHIDFIFDKRPWRYIDSFVLYQEGTKLATVKASESTISSVGNEYRLRFSNLNAVVKKGDKDSFILEAKALNSISSSRENDTLSVYVPEDGIRAKDTTKAITTAPSKDIDPRTFNFRDAENDGELTVSLASDSTESGTIAVKELSNTSGITVMIANVKADDADVTLEEIYVKVDSSEATVSNVVRSLTLIFDGKSIATENVVKNGSSPITGRDEDGNSYTIIGANEYYVHFDDIDDIEIDEDSREALTFKAEFFKHSGRYSSGAEITFTLRAIEGENQFGEDVVNGNLTTGDNRTFSLYTEGASFAFVGEQANTTGTTNQTGTFTLTFDITAFGDDIYVPTGADRQTGTTTIGGVGAEYSIVNGSGQRYALGTFSDTMSIKGAKETGGYFKINEGSTHRVTIQISLNNIGAAADFYRAELEAFRFKIGSPSGTEHTITTGFNDFETDMVSVRN